MNLKTLNRSNEVYRVKTSRSDPLKYHSRGPQRDPTFDQASCQETPSFCSWREPVCVADFAHPIPKVWPAMRTRRGILCSKNLFHKIMWEHLYDEDLFPDENAEI